LKYLFLLLTCSLFAVTVTAQNNPPLSKHSKIYIVRHAEKLSGDDPLLTEDGNKRAVDLMRVLKNKKISRIYVTEFKRTQNTGDSMRLQLSIDTIQINADTSCASLFAAITQHDDWNKSILIITHSNIIQKIIYKLGIIDFPQENIPAAEFDNLYIVSLKKKKAVLKHLKYGKPSGSSAEMMH
jgi:2,3-bisphosphoglycerate-dependent phosphoglycerate mutase